MFYTNRTSYNKIRQVGSICERGLSGQTFFDYISIGEEQRLLIVVFISFVNMPLCCGKSFKNRFLGRMRWKDWTPALPF